MYFYAVQHLETTMRYLETKKENSEKARALKKLMKKWLTTAETRRKANLLIAKNPGLKTGKVVSLRKADQ